MDPNNPASWIPVVLNGGGWAAFLFYIFVVVPKDKREERERRDKLMAAREDRSDAAAATAHDERRGMMAQFAQQIDKERERADKQMQADRADCDQKFEKLQKNFEQVQQVIGQQGGRMQDTLDIAKTTAADNRTILSEIRALIAARGTPERRQSGGQ